MAWIVTGARGSRWQVADWIARNAWEFVLPALRNAGGEELAERCRTGYAGAAHRIDLSDVLDDERGARVWRDAVHAAVTAARAEPAAAWNEPVRQTEFIAALERLESLARGGGNAVVVDAARAHAAPPVARARKNAVPGP